VSRSPISRRQRAGHALPPKDVVELEGGAVRQPGAICCRASVALDTTSLSFEDQGGEKLVVAATRRTTGPILNQMIAAGHGQERSRCCYEMGPRKHRRR